MKKVLTAVFSGYSREIVDFINTQELTKENIIEIVYNPEMKKYTMFFTRNDNNENK